MIGKLWFRWRCWRDKHKDVLYLVGHHPAKKCLRCGRPTPMTNDEFRQARLRLPAWLQAPGDRDVVEEKQDQ